MTKQTLTAAAKEVLPEPAGANRSTSPASERICAVCSGTGWRPAGDEDLRYRRCECIRIRMIAERLAAIPARFGAADLDSYRAQNPRQEQALALMRSRLEGSWYLTGTYGTGKTHLLYAQYRQMASAGRTLCHVRTARELMEELRRAELDDKFVSPVMQAAYAPAPYHLFWDDIDKLKPTDFKTEVLFELVDALYRRNHGLTITANYTLRDLVERERLHSAIVRRLDDMCQVIEI